MTNSAPRTLCIVQWVTFLAVLVSSIAVPRLVCAADARLAVKETVLVTVGLDVNRTSLVVSSDGAHFFYNGARKDGPYAVLDGKEIPEYKGATVYLSSNCRHVATARWVGGDRFLAIDGAEPIGPFANVFSFTWSPDGSRWIASWQIDRKHYVVADGQQVDTETLENAVYSSDSKHLNYSVGNGDGFHVVADGKPQKSYLYGSPIALSADGLHHAYAAKVGEGQWACVVDGAEIGKRYRRVYAPRLSADGKRSAFIGELGDNQFCAVVDGQEGKTYRRLVTVDPPIFSPDGHSCAYPAMLPDKNMVIVRDGRESKSYPNAATPTFSPDGKRLAFVRVAVNGGKQASRLVIDDAEIGNDYLLVNTVTFTPDSSRVAFLARTDRGWVPVFDGAQGEPYDEIIRAVYFDGPAAFHCFALRADKLLRVDVALK